tara:strand:+ start:8351 stop:10108 length:1758 start_codon:yes stop_codon:yes gene_type:complete
MSFFVADNKIPITQKSIGIPATNGLSYNPSQQIDFYIDPQQVKFFNPKNSYLSFDVAIKQKGDVDGQLTRLMLDSHIGAQVLIREIRIFDGSNNALLEEIVGYNINTSVKYDYECNDSLRNKRALSEGAGYRGVNEGSQGCGESFQNSAINQYSVKNPDTTASASLVNASYQNCKVCLPLNTGIFSNDKVFPALLTQGLRISILLEDSVRCIRQCEGAMVNRKTVLNPFIHSQNGCLTNTGAGSGSYVAGVNASNIYLENFNGYTNPEFLPFVVGESIGIFKTNVPGYVAMRAGAVGTYPVIKSIGLETVNGRSLIKVNTTNFSLTAALGTNSNASHVIFTKSADVGAPLTTTYQLNNVELYLEVVDMGQNYENDMMRKMKEGGTINYDFLSTTNYRYSQLAGDIVANIQLPIENRRMRSIIAVPTDSSVYTQTQVLTASGTYAEEVGGGNDFLLHQDRCGLVGISDNISSYQFLYDGKLQPSRLVDCSKTSSKLSISQQHLIELEKALSSAGITGQSLLEFNRNFLIGRSLTAGQNGVYDGRGKQFSLQVNYQGTPPTKNKLWNNFVHHMRRLVIKGDSIFVEV